MKLKLLHADENDKRFYRPMIINNQIIPILRYNTNLKYFYIGNKESAGFNRYNVGLKKL